MPSSVSNVGLTVGKPWQRKHGRKGTALNPRFGEWMMGFPYGWTDMPGVPRTGQLHCVGNAVQPQVAELAALLLLGEWLA